VGTGGVGDTFEVCIGMETSLCGEKVGMEMKLCHRTAVSCSGNGDRVPAPALNSRPALKSP